jgi:hypothetical protein
MSEPKAPRPWYLVGADLFAILIKLADAPFVEVLVFAFRAEFEGVFQMIIHETNSYDKEEDRRS